MTELEQNIEADIYWRQSQLSTLKLILHKSSMTEQQREVFKIYFVPAIYSLWEGFIKTIFTYYLSEVNKKKLSSDMLHINYVSHTLDCDKRTDLTFSRKDESKRRSCVEEIRKSLVKNPFIVSIKIPTESNVNFKVLMKIFNTFNFDMIDNKYSKDIDGFLHVRNKISHGENAISLTDDKINDYCNLVNELMVEVSGKVLEGFYKKRYMVCVSKE